MMLTKIFGDIKTGSLARLPFLGYVLLLSLVLVMIMIGVGAFIGINEEMIAGDIEQAQQVLTDKFSDVMMLGIFILNVLLLILGAAIVAMFTFAYYNIMAKRFRDMGLPGWISVLSVILLAVLLGIILSPQAIQLFDAIVFLALVLIPGGLFSKSLSR